MSGSKNSTVHRTNMIPALTECLMLNCSEIHMGVNQWVLRHEFIWLKMTIIIIPLVWKLLFLKDISRPSSSLQVHLVPLYCYYQSNVLFPSTNLTFIWIFYNQAIPPSTSPICFQKTTLSGLSKISLSGHLPSRLCCKIYTWLTQYSGPWLPRTVLLLSIAGTHFSGLLPRPGIHHTTSSFQLTHSCTPLQQVLHFYSPPPPSCHHPSCGLMIPRSIIKITALQTFPLLLLF